MEDQWSECAAQATAAFAAAATAEDLEAARVEYLGRRGKLAALLSQLPHLPAEERGPAGKRANSSKTAIEQAFTAATLRITPGAHGEPLDITLPGIPPVRGHLHLTTQAIADITAIFHEIGFSRTHHPEVDGDYYAFEALNMPKDHPARDEWETFFVGDRKGNVQTGELGKVVLTPHTSNGQVREMEKGYLPIRMISIGKTYRRQSSARHLSMFHQFEGLMIDERVTITDLQGVCDFFVERFFGKGTTTRLRPFHFQFTEPSFELDISCTVCGGSGMVRGAKCKLCKGGWLELGGAGMVHPNVLKAGGLNPKKVQGFAFGWGIERTAMMRSGLNIDDIRTFYRNDLRFLQQL